MTEEEEGRVAETGVAVVAVVPQNNDEQEVGTTQRVQFSPFVRESTRNVTVR